MNLNSLVNMQMLHQEVKRKAGPYDALAAAAPDAKKTAISDGSTGLPVGVTTPLDQDHDQDPLASMFAKNDEDVLIHEENQLLASMFGKNDEDIVKEELSDTSYHSSDDEDPVFDDHTTIVYDATFGDLTPLEDVLAQFYDPHSKAYETMRK